MEAVLNLFWNTAIAASWLLVLWKLWPYAREKAVGADLLAFFVVGLLSIPLHSLTWHVFPQIWFSSHSVFGILWNNIVMVGLVEEFAKWTIFALAMQGSGKLRAPEDAVFLAAAVALAFATVENYEYASRYGLWILRTRGWLTSLGHMALASIWAFVWASVTWQEHGRVTRPAFGVTASAIVPAGLIHGLYNTVAWFGGLRNAVGFQVLVLLTALIVIAALLKHSPYRGFSLREAEQAIPVLREGLRRHPSSVLLQRRLAVHLLHQGAYADAAQAFARVARLQGGSTGTIDFFSALAAHGATRSHPDGVAHASSGHRIRPVDSAALVGAFRGLPESVQRQIRQSLSDLLGSDRDLLRKVQDMLRVSDRSRPDAYVATIVRPPDPRVAIRARRKALELREATERRRSTDERERRIAAMTLDQREAMARGLQHAIEQVGRQSSS